MLDCFDAKTTAAFACDLLARRASAEGPRLRGNCRRSQQRHAKNKRAALFHRNNA